MNGKIPPKKQANKTQKTIQIRKPIKLCDITHGHIAQYSSACAGVAAAR